MSLQVMFPSSLKRRQPSLLSEGGWEQCTPRFIILPCKVAIGLTTYWLENKAKSLLHATEEISWAYEDKPPITI